MRSFALFGDLPASAQGGPAEDEDFFILLLGVALTTSLTTTPVDATSHDEIVIGFPHLDLDAHYLSDYGFVEGDGRMHRGIDISSPKGTPIVAVADGQVITMASAARSGHYIVIAHADGLESWYMHLNNDAIGTDDGRSGTVAAFPGVFEVDNYVRAGNAIAYVGDSGNAEATKPHTYFELHLNGRAIDPYRHVRNAEERFAMATAVAMGENPFR